MTRDNQATPGFTPEEIKDFHREVDAVKRTRVWMKANGLSEYVVEHIKRLFKPNRQRLLLYYGQDKPQVRPFKKKGSDDTTT